MVRKVPLDQQRGRGRSTEKSTERGRQCQYVCTSVEGWVKSSDLVAYLDYNRHLLTDFADGFMVPRMQRGFIQFEERQSEVEEIKSLSIAFC